MPTGGKAEQAPRSSPTARSGNYSPSARASISSVIFPLLQIRNTECGHFRCDVTRSPTAQQPWRNLGFPGGCCGRITPGTRFPCSAVSQLPIRTPNFLAPLTRRIPAARSGLSTGIGSFVCKAPDRRKLEVDSGGGVVCLLKEDAIPSHNGFVEGQTGLRAVPFDELLDGVIVLSRGTLGC